QFRRNVVAASMHDDHIAELCPFRPMHGHDNRQALFNEPLAYRLHTDPVVSQPARCLAWIAPDKHRDLFVVESRVLLALFEPLVELRGNILKLLIEGVKASDRRCNTCTK